MIYRTKQKTVKALPVGYILQTAESNFKGLPTWVKKAYQDQKLFFGFSQLRVVEVDWRKDARPGEMLIQCPNKGLFTLKEKEFHELYEDEFASTSSNDLPELSNKHVIKDGTIFYRDSRGGLWLAE